MNILKTIYDFLNNIPDICGCKHLETGSRPYRLCREAFHLFISMVIGMICEWFRFTIPGGLTLLGILLIHELADIKYHEQTLLKTFFDILVWTSGFFSGVLIIYFLLFS